jgi:hypothetical protein
MWRALTLIYLLTTTPLPDYPVMEIAASSVRSQWQLKPPAAFTFKGKGALMAQKWSFGGGGLDWMTQNPTNVLNPTASSVDSSPPLRQEFFSMGWHDFIKSSIWPSVSFGGVRLWDNHVSWEEIETANQRYNWTNLDSWLEAAASRGNDVLYAFGRTPPWASLRPQEACGYGVGCAAPPADVNAGDNVWKAFVTALVQHSLASSGAHIKYYEIWNEPDCTKGCTWTGTDAQMVIMARDAYNIIHNSDPNALVLGPSAHGLNLVSWLQRYYAAGGAPYQDIVSFHAYVGLNLNQLPSIVDNTRALMARYGIGNEPLWCTEGSWGPIKDLTPAQQASYLAQEYVILWSKKVARYYWYCWDGPPQWGVLWNQATGINEAGTTYGLLENWLIGSLSPSSPCSQMADGTWYCNLTLSNGAPAEIVWNSDTTITKAVGPAFTTYL